LQLVDGASFAPAVLALSDAQALSVPWSFLGCPVWLSNVVADVPVQLSLDGAYSLQLPVPPNPGLVGFRFAAQGLQLITPLLSFTNALDLTVQ
jgi:hypothetical protein